MAIALRYIFRKQVGRASACLANLALYRVMQQETTDPLAARLLHDIVLDLEAELERLPQSVGLDAA